MRKTRMACAATATAYAWGSWMYIVLSYAGFWGYISTVLLLFLAAGLWVNAIDELKRSNQ